MKLITVILLNILVVCLQLTDEQIFVYGQSTSAMSATTLQSSMTTMASAQNATMAMTTSNSNATNNAMTTISSATTSAPTTTKSNSAIRVYAATEHMPLLLLTSISLTSLLLH